MTPPQTIDIPIGIGLVITVPLGITQSDFRMLKKAVMLYKPMFVLPDPPYEPDYQI